MTLSPLYTCTWSLVQKSNISLDQLSLAFVDDNNFFIFLAFDFVGSVWSFDFFTITTTANDLRLRRIFYPRFNHLFSYLDS